MLLIKMLLISVRCSTLSVPLVDPYNSNGPCTKARTLHVWFKKKIVCTLQTTLFYEYLPAKHTTQTLPQ